MNREYYAGIDIGGTKIKILICNESFQMEAQRILPTKAPILPDRQVHRLCQCIEEMLKENGISTEALLGVCIALPGLVDQKNNIPIRMGVLGWKEGTMDIAPLMAAQLHIPVLLINDGNAHLLGECRFGRAKNYQNVVLMTLGTGVGGAILANGQLVTGEYGLSSEFGHIVVAVENGERCNCGSVGCLQAYCSARGIRAYALEQMANCKDSILWKFTQGIPERLDVEMITRGAEEQDALCLKIYKRTSRYLGAGIATLISVLNPAFFLVGGGVANAHDFLIEPTRKEVERRLMHHRQKCQIEAAGLGTMAGAWGACVWIAEHIV